MAQNARWATRRALVASLQQDDALTGVQVTRGWMGDAMELETIWLGHTANTGTLEVPVFTGPDTVANPISYNDRFTIPVHIMASTPGQSAEEAEDRAETLYLAVERVIRTDPQLLALTDEDTEPWSGLVHALLGDIAGPETFAVLEGFASFVDVSLSCLSRISGGAE